MPSPRSLNSLYELTEELETHHYLAWVAEESYGASDRVHPKEVDKIESLGNGVRVYAEGVQGGEYYYVAYPDGGSDGYFVNPKKDAPVNKGPVVFAELTDSDDLVPVKKGYYDSRGL